MSLLRVNPARDKNELEIIQALREVGAIVWPISGAAIPDLLVGWQGEWLLLEVKSARGKLTPHQMAFFDLAKLRGNKAYVVRSVDEALEILKEME